MRRSLLLAITVLSWLSVVYAVPQAESGAAQSASSGTIGPADIWQPPQDFVAKANTVCGKGAGPVSFSACFINQMSASGASPDAVNFTRMLADQSDGQVGILVAFKKFGPVDAAQVLYPLRANDNYGLLLVNGTPAILDVDDLKKLDRAGMEKDPMFLAVKQKFPKSDVWPGDRSGSEPWPRVSPLPDGGTQFLVSYPLIDGCHACRRTGVARFGWDFDASGKFLRTSFVPTPPPPRLLRHPPKTPDTSQQPSTDQQPAPAPPSTP